MSSRDGYIVVLYSTSAEAQECGEHTVQPVRRVYAFAQSKFDAFGGGDGELLSSVNLQGPDQQRRLHSRYPPGREASHSPKSSSEQLRATHLEDTKADLLKDRTP